MRASIVSYHCPGRRSPFAPPPRCVTGPRDRTPDSHLRWICAAWRDFAATADISDGGKGRFRLFARGRCTLGFEYHTFTWTVPFKARLFGIAFSDLTRANFLFLNLRIGKYEMLTEPLVASALPAYYHAGFLSALEPGETVYLRVKAIA